METQRFVTKVTVTQEGFTSCVTYKITRMWVWASLEQRWPAATLPLRTAMRVVGILAALLWEAMVLRHGYEGMSSWRPVLGYVLSVPFRAFGVYIIATCILRTIRNMAAPTRLVATDSEGA